MAIVFTPTAHTSAGIQAAVDACAAAGGGVLCLSGAYTLSDTVTILPASLSNPQIIMDVMCSPGTAFTWTGGANLPMFKMEGWVYSQWNGGAFQLGSQVGTVGILLNTSTAYQSLHANTFNNVLMVTQAANQICYKSDAESGWGDVSMITWNNCLETSETSHDNGTIAYQNNVQNGLNWTWNNGITAFMGIMFQASGCAAGSGGISTHGGGGGMYFFGKASSHNILDFDFNWPGAYGVYGGRFENDHAFMNVGGGGQQMVTTVDLVGVDVNEVGYPSETTPIPGVIANIKSPAMVNVSGRFSNTEGTPQYLTYFDETAFNINMSGAYKCGTLDIQNIAITAEGPVYTNSDPGCFAVYDYGQTWCEDVWNAGVSINTGAGANYRGKV